MTISFIAFLRRRPSRRDGVHLVGDCVLFELFLPNHFLFIVRAFLLLLRNLTGRGIVSYDQIIIDERVRSQGEGEDEATQQDNILTSSSY